MYGVLYCVDVVRGAEGGKGEQRKKHARVSEAKRRGRKARQKGEAKRLEVFGCFCSRLSNWFSAMTLTLLALLRG